MSPIEENRLLGTENCLNKFVAMQQSSLMHYYAEAECSSDGSDADTNTINRQPKKLRPHHKATNNVMANCGDECQCHRCKNYKDTDQNIKGHTYHLVMKGWFLK
jgi:hypothetical protein